MHFSSRFLCALALVSGSSAALAQAPKGSKFPFPEKLTYRIEWRMINAGTATVQLSRDQPDDWTVNLHLESAGLVSRLYRVLDSYKAAMTDRFCGISAQLDAQEGKRHTLTHLIFDDPQHKVEYNEHDVLKNTSAKNRLAIAPCTHEITGALAELRASDLQPGHAVTIPITNGKKMAHARVEAQAKERVSVNGKTYSTTRYEAFLFDNVLYKRKGTFFVWITDDSERMPVQFRIHLGFPVGTITISLEKEERL
ncbi:MAG TPA: DUF3108 domain-containing protein [Bryobacteraceae bacterium]|jgi:hypothetical protein|nr:DUF3108 domain-containing protein [Bryobacteraceae bacterium]